MGPELVGYPHQSRSYAHTRRVLLFVPEKTRLAVVMPATLQARSVPEHDSRLVKLACIDRPAKRLRAVCLVLA